LIREFGGGPGDGLMGAVLTAFHRWDTVFGGGGKERVHRRILLVHSL